ncbi:hypothetical protein [Niastella sp. OAS944]|uniref:hypothetical protein n=1 Tax=Niastella sp. OAS944 TaxID=2664089 RepID=UPI00348F723F|nr:hypothetical protein [Chitinophagaceae bacterium OAS944]
MTTKKINLPYKSVEFTFHQGNNSSWWSAQLVIDIIAIEFYINLPSDQTNEVDWKDVADLITTLDYPHRLHYLVAHAQTLATAVGEAFFKGGSEQYEMQFSKSIHYKGKDHYGSSNYAKWEISFTYGTPDRTDGDAYGDYIVDFAGSQIIGARRIQV